MREGIVVRKYDQNVYNAGMLAQIFYSMYPLIRVKAHGELK